MLAAGTVIGGRYRLTRLLGEGGMGTVWAAVNDAFGREVAVKVMLRDVVEQDPTSIERFFTEARICGTIRHPGIVDVLDVGRTDEGSPFLVMELLDGDSLDNILHRTGTMRPLEILPVVREVARTLALAHDKGVIHRDIKPGNLFLHRLPTGQIVAKLLDFGISKVNGPHGGTGGSTTVTRTGIVVGSPAYMSPEQAAGRVELDGRSDVYGLGVILYEALSGRLPFTEQNYNALIIDIAVREPPALGTVAHGLPKPVLELVKATMMHERDERIPNAAVLADRIEATLAALGSSSSHALPDPASLVGDGTAGPRHGTAAQTSTALATNTRLRAVPRKRVAVTALITFFVALFAAVIWFKVAPPRALRAIATPLPESGVPPVASAPPLVVSASASVQVVTTAATEAPTTSATAPSLVPTTSAKVPVQGPHKPVKSPSQQQKGVWKYD